MKSNREVWGIPRTSRFYYVILQLSVYHNGVYWKIFKG